MKATLILTVILCSVAVSASAQSDRDAAIDLALEAQAHFAEGRVAETIDALRRARALYPEPVLLYNLGRAYEAQGQEPEALEAYEGYLRELPEGPNAASLRTRVESLRRSIAERERLEAERAAEERRRIEEQRRRQEAEARVSQRVSPAAWVVLGVGAAALAVGGGLAGAAASRREAANTAPSHAEAVSGFNGAERLATSANILLIAGGTIAAGGLTWVLVSALREPSDDAHAVSVGAGTVHYRHRW